MRRKFCSSYDWRGSTSRREGGQVVGTLTARLRRSFYNPVFRQPTGLEIVTGMWHNTMACPALAAPPRAAWLVLHSLLRRVLPAKHNQKPPRARADRELPKAARVLALPDLRHRALIRLSQGSRPGLKMMRRPRYVLVCVCLPYTSGVCICVLCVCMVCT